MSKMSSRNITPYRLTLFLCGCALAVLALALPKTGLAESGHGGVQEAAKQATAPFDDARIMDSTIPSQVKTVLALDKYQGGPFWVEARKDEISRFQCSVCHTDKQPTITNAAKMTHGDIHFGHGPEENRLDCFQCHMEKGRDFLVGRADEKIDFDHSYQLCGSCHFRQKKDWVGGAHGKRVDNWSGKRVIKNCTSCHNPHSPRFAKRWPKTYSLPLE